MTPTSPPWAQTPDEVLTTLDTGPEGLTHAEAEDRLTTQGLNRLPAPLRAGFLKRLAGHLNDVLIYLLIGAAAVKAIMAIMGDADSWIDFSVIVAVAVINVAIGLVQEGKATRALDAIKGMLSTRAYALREGTLTDIDAETLVTGDVIRLKPGDRIPADARLLEATNLQVEESALTGESVAAVKAVPPVTAKASVGDRAPMLFSGTLVVAGTGTAVVTATGAGTEIGRIQTMIAEADELETPLARTLGRFGLLLAWIILSLGAIMALFGWLVHGMSGTDLVSATIGFAVAAIPEGLPALVTITLALGVQHMARRRAITRRMPAVETLGSVSTICSDKTGTLTQNEMTVRCVHTRANAFNVSGTGYAPLGEITLADTPILPASQPALMAFAETMGLANDAVIEQTSGRWHLVGEPTEGSLAVLALKAGVAGKGWHRLAEIPFDSATKYMAVLCEDPSGARHVLVKGSTAAVAERCTTQLGADGKVEPFDAAFWDEQVEQISRRGLRVLAAARTEAPAATNKLPAGGPTGLTFLGVAGIVDPPRPEAIAAISQARGAGIAVTMITGDHAGTAKAIASEMGLIDDLDSPALTGVELEAMSDAQLAEVVRDVHIYARTSPEHKIRIVRALQARGEVVAMTGDGVNDAPALTQANVGVAMGIKGTEATKEAADVVLADDNFATIERAVEEGRRIYDNIRKSVLFLLPTNGAQSLVILAAILLGWSALPLLPVQVLWINMITAVTLSLPLALEPQEPGIMSRPPRDPQAPLIDGAMLRRVLFVSLVVAGATLATFQLAYQVLGVPIAQAQAASVTMLALGQAAYLLNCRFLSRSSITVEVLRGNKFIWVSVVGIITLQLAFMHLSFMRRLFRVQPIGWREWGICLGLSIVIFLVVEGAKSWGRRSAT
ncbi:MAG: HAD-IC family P-type ATPase, partial [Promicromonosporaceae bacterium]|nr:HAD-IC family P-type ATPase [Promicromonosporaceae bacterium]